MQHFHIISLPSNKVVHVASGTWGLGTGYNPCVRSRRYTKVSLPLQDHVLLPLVTEEEGEEEKENPYLVVHPNYVVES